jgi:hypothetical protein
MKNRRDPDAKIGASAMFHDTIDSRSLRIQMPNFEIEDNSNASLIIKSLLSSCLVNFELLFLDTDPSF